jgi:hypothetical protein
VDRDPGISAQNHSTRPAPGHFEADRDLTGFESADRADGRPLLTSINHWGYSPLALTPSTAPVVAAITHARLSGKAPAQTFSPRSQPESVPDMCFGRWDIVHDPHYYEPGITARRSVHQGLSDVIDLLINVEDCAVQLLAELDGILDEAF